MTRWMRASGLSREFALWFEFTSNYGHFRVTQIEDAARARSVRIGSVSRTA